MTLRRLPEVHAVTPMYNWPQPRRYTDSLNYLTPSFLVNIIVFPLLVLLYPSLQLMNPFFMVPRPDLNEKNKKAPLKTSLSYHVDHLTFIHPAWKLFGVVYKSPLWPVTRALVLKSSISM